MAKSSSSSKFISANLTKSYSSTISLSPTSSTTSGTSSSGLQRARSHGGMVLLSRPGRSQPSASSTSRTSKLVVPRPMNLPSLRKEHAGKDRNITLVTPSGLSGWSKQQMLPPGDAPAPPSTPSDLNSVRSASTASESPSHSHGGVAPSNGEHSKQSTQSYQAPEGGFTTHSATSTRNGNAGSLMPPPHSQPSGSTVIVKGEDFPTLQAAVRPLASPSGQCQRVMHHRQRDRQHEIEDQHSKLRAAESKLRAAESKQAHDDTRSLKQHLGVDGGRSFETQGVTESTHRRAYGTSPLIRLTHTSNWTDDERETLQGVHQQGSMQFDRLELNGSRSMRPNDDRWALDHEGAVQSGRASSKYESYTGLARDSRNQDRNVDFSFERRNGRFSNDIAKGLQSDHLHVYLLEGAGYWSRRPGKSELFNRDLSFTKERSYNNDARLGNVHSKSLDSRNIDSSRERRASLMSDPAVIEHGGGSRDGSIKEDAFSSSRRGMDNWQVERSKRDGGFNQFSRFDPGSGQAHPGARNNLSGFDRGWEKRSTAVYRQDPFLEDSMSSKVSSPVILEAFVGISGFEAKTLRRKKSEFQDFHDPARELFEAELERVQSMQEQERQRMADERERAVELARKEEEERKRRAIEEEGLRLKLEQEARETAAEAQRKEEEAARKAEELRRAREDEKRTIIAEEERRKEAARRKLLELEERIAKRESTQRQRGFSEREAEDAVTEVGHTLPRKEPIQEPRVESSMRLPPDSREGGNVLGLTERVVKMKRNETLVEDRPGLSVGLRKPNLRDEFPPRDNEWEYREFSFQNSSTRAQRSSPTGASQGSLFTHAQERVHTEWLTQREQHWHSGQSKGFGRSSSLDMNADHRGSGIESDVDDWWGRDNGSKFQEEQRLNSPPLYLHTNGGGMDFPSTGRLRQSLPKQPRVPPPIFQRVTTQRQTFHLESTHTPSSACIVDKSHEEHDNAHYQGTSLEPGKDKVEHKDRVWREMQAREKTSSNTSKEVLSVSDTISEQGSVMALGASQEHISPPDEIDEFSDLDESVEQLSDVTEAEERLEEVETKVEVGVPTNREEQSDEERIWLVNAKAEALAETVHADELQDEVANSLEEKEWDSLRIGGNEGDIQKHAIEAGEADESTWDGPNTEEVRHGALDDLDSSLLRNEPRVEVFEQQDDIKMNDSAKQGPVQGDVEQPRDEKSPAISMELVLEGQTPSQAYGQSFAQHFQQPFSFMAIPLPHSTPLGGTPRPPMLSSMQSQQEPPYYLHNPLQIGLFPCMPLLPNAIQIGSIQMPLDVHPQVTPSAQLQHQQPPVFQFGQICHLSQPASPFQSAVDMHPAVQPLLPQHQVELSSLMVGSQGLRKGDEVFKNSNHMPEESSHDVSSVLDTFSDKPIDIDLSRGSSSSLTEQLDRNHSVVSNGEAQTSFFGSESGQKAPSLARDDKVSDVKDEVSVGKITGARRRDNIARASGIYGRGRSKITVEKNPDRRDQYSTVRTLQETPVKGGGGRMFGHNYGRAEYKVRKPAASEGKMELGVGQGKHPSTQGMDVGLTDGLKGIGRSSAPFKSNIKVGPPQQTGFVSVAEQLGIEPQLNKDEFIEVRSKRQILREQRGNHDKTKSKELKVREQVARKQQKLLGNLGTPEGSGSSALGQLGSAQRPFMSAQKSVNEGRTDNQVNASYGPRLQERCVSSTSMGLSGKVLSNDSYKLSKASNSGQFQPVPAGNDINTKRGHPVGAAGGKRAPDGTRMMTSAWGEQQSSHKVVSLTQIQLEESMKPFHSDSLPLKTACSPESSVPFMESKNLHASISDENVTLSANALVLPGPISSLLAGEKIQFGAVTSPTILSSSSCPSSPSRIGAVGLRIATDLSSSHARSYFGQKGNGGFTHGKIGITTDDDSRGKLVDSEAEAEAAASAVAVAAISNDELIEGHPGVNTPLGDGIPSSSYSSFTSSSGLQATGSGADDALAVALPPDLSVEAPGPFVQSPLSHHPSSAGFAVQPLTSRASPFPFMEMGTIARGPIFSYGSHGDASMGSIEPGFGTLGAGGVAGWQQRQSSTPDSFYGAPPPYMGSGGLTGIQGHPQMLVYSNPFTPMGQFGQLGVSFLGTTYHPSGKQPDWTHTPFGTGGGQHGDLNSGVSVIMDSQQNGVGSNVQPFSVPGCSILPVPTPMNVFDPSFSGPFQTHWSRAPAPPFASYHVSGPPGPIAPGLNLQLRNMPPFPNESVGPVSQSLHMNDGPHRVSEVSGSCSEIQFSDELGFGSAAISNSRACSDDEVPLNRGSSTVVVQVPVGSSQHLQHK